MSNTRFDGSFSRSSLETLTRKGLLRLWNYQNGQFVIFLRNFVDRCFFQRFKWFLVKCIIEFFLFLFTLISLRMEILIVKLIKLEFGSESQIMTIFILKCS